MHDLRRFVERHDWQGERRRITRPPTELVRVVVDGSHRRVDVRGTRRAGLLRLDTGTSRPTRLSLSQRRRFGRAAGAAQAAQDCEHEIVGIRPGEKIHEMLLSADEARHSVELDDMYIICPEDPDVRHTPPDDAQPVREGFSFCSDSNQRWLSSEQFRALASDVIPSATSLQST